MTITVHAGQRFLERVMKQKKYTVIEVDFAMRYLKKLLSDVVPMGANNHFVLPGFENYKAVYRQNAVVTIIAKKFQ